MDVPGRTKAESNIVAIISANARRSSRSRLSGRVGCSDSGADSTSIFIEPLSSLTDSYHIPMVLGSDESIQLLESCSKGQPMSDQDYSPLHPTGVIEDTHA